MAGLSMRSGCVVFTLDLMHPDQRQEAAQGAIKADNVVHVISKLMANSSMGQLLKDASTMHVQVRMACWEA